MEAAVTAEPVSQVAELTPLRGDPSQFLERLEGFGKIEDPKVRKDIQKTGRDDYIWEAHMQNILNTHEDKTLPEDEKKSRLQEMVDTALILGMKEKKKINQALVSLANHYGLQILDEGGADLGRRKFLKRGGIVAASVIAAGFVGKTAFEAVLASAKSMSADTIKLKSADVYAGSRLPGGAKPEVITPKSTATPQPKPEVTPEPTPEATAEPTPEPDPEEVAKKEIGEQTLAEYFLGDLINIFKETRKAKFDSDPAYAERVAKEYLESDNMTVLVMGIDETRERPEKGVWNGNGWGRSDVFMLINFDPATFKTTVISFPRDLLVPELKDFEKELSDGMRINEITQTPFLKPGTDSFELARRVAESATRLPVDMCMEFNIDFTQGHSYTDSTSDGMFNNLFPDGLGINVPSKIVDNAYPVGYGTKVLTINQGRQKMDGRQLTEYARTRHSDSAFGREERQRQVLMSATKVLGPAILADVAKGDSDTFDNIISSLEEQADDHNLFYDVDIAAILGNIKDNIADLRSTPKGLAILALLASNSAPAMTSLKDGNGFTSFGPSRDNGVVSNVTSQDKYYKPGQSLLKVAGSQPGATPTRFGNHLSYWANFRKKVSDLL